MTEAKTKEGETIQVSNSTMHYTQKGSIAEAFQNDVENLNAAKRFIQNYVAALNGTESIDDIITDCMYSKEVLTYVGDLPKGNAIRRSRFWMMQLSVSTAIRSYTDRKINHAE